MQSMVEGASTSAAPVILPLHRPRRSPSPALRVRNRLSLVVLDFPGGEGIIAP